MYKYNTKIVPIIITPVTITIVKVTSKNKYNKVINLTEIIK